MLLVVLQHQPMGETKEGYASLGVFLLVYVTEEAMGMKSSLP